MNTITYENNTYEIVDEFPVGYLIWNIGKHAPEGYLPLCRPSQEQPFPGGRQIDANSLKAMKVDGAQIILSAAHAGDTLAELEEQVRRYGNCDPRSSQGYWAEKARQALPYLRKIKGVERLKCWEDLVHEV